MQVAIMVWTKPGGILNQEERYNQKLDQFPVHLEIEVSGLNFLLVLLKQITFKKNYRKPCNKFNLLVFRLFRRVDQYITTISW